MNGAFFSEARSLPLFFNPLILLYRFGGDRSGRFGAVVSLHAGGRGADGAPSLAGAETSGDAK